MPTNSAPAAGETASDGLLQREVAELMGISRSRVAQLVGAGHLRRNAEGKITRAEVERCKREEPINWTHPASRGGKPSKEVMRQRMIAERWCWVASEMRREGWGDLRNDQWRRLFEDLTAAMKKFNLEVK